MNKTENKKRILKRVFYVVLCVAAVSLVITIMHRQSTEMYEEYYSIVGSVVEAKGSLRTEYYVMLDGVDVPIHCTNYEYYYLTNPKIFSSDEEDYQDAYYQNINI